MPALLSLGRSSGGDGQPGMIRRALGARGPRNNDSVVVEMNDAQRQNNLAADDQPQATSHDRQASGRSILSNLSIPSLGAMRQRERDNEMLRQRARAESGRPPSPTPAQLEAGMAPADFNAHAAAAASVGAGPPIDAALQPIPARQAAPKKSGKSRREREEAASLFGPNLANYFGSGNSSSGAITAPSSAATALNKQSAFSPTSPDPNGNTVAARRARLGSRGRVRGASLSGLSMMSLGAESITSNGGIALSPNPNETGAAGAGIMDGSTHDLINQVTRENNAAVGDIAMSEGVDLETLKRWIDKSAGSPPGSSPAETSALPLCTTLQSFVNLKRNTVRLKQNATEELAASENIGSESKNDPGPLGSDKLRGLTSTSDVNLLRSSPSLSILPAMSADRGSEVFGLPDSTHTVYFEYDCAAPCASVQIFVRASRKHGSWLSFVPPADGLPDTLPDGTPAMLAQKGPPPHVLGWPVHVARLRKGFGVGHKASLALDLKYYAPPSAKTMADEQAQRDQVGDETRDQAASQAGPAAIPETPAWDIQRRLELDLEEQEEDSRAERLRRLAHANANHNGRVGSAFLPNVSAGDDTGAATNVGSYAAAAAPAEEPAVETKEQRLAREKAERETLKITVVVEALDENAQPLKEPNLQTTYLRLTSLPIKKNATDPAPATPETPRSWSAQVEGQEAEIGPHRFQLQELYGLSSKPPPVRPAPANEDGEGEEEGTGDTGAPAVFPDMDTSNGTECLICLSAPPTTLLLPCTHGLCLECAVQLRDSIIGIRQSERRRGRTPRRKYACPVCRRGYTSMLHLSKADEKLVVQARAEGTTLT